jgi:hypothetical protein
MRCLALFLALTACAQQTTLVGRMMAFDKNHDGKLTRDEITDQRLLALFDRADTNHDGVVTKDELVALAARETSTQPDRAPGGGPGGPGGRGFGGGRGGGPQPGQIMPGGMMDRLNLTGDQRAKIQALQKEIDAKLDAILNPEQKQQMKQGPGGPPPPGR